MSTKQIYNQLCAIYPISEDVFERLSFFVARLQEWQKKTNLVAPSTLDDIWHRHVGDSLQCLAIKPKARKWLDIGSGGGFPGLVIAAVMADHTDGEIFLIESNHKKTAFLRQVNRQMAAPGKIVTARIEEAEIGSYKPEIITARALTALPGLLDLTCDWLSGNTVGLFHKGREYRSELEECNGVWSFDLLNHPSIISTDSVILEIANLNHVSGQGN